MLTATTIFTAQHSTAQHSTGLTALYSNVNTFSANFINYDTAYYALMGVVRRFSVSGEVIPSADG